MHDLQLLENRASRFGKTVNRRLFLFSISGFDRDLVDGADPNRVLLVGPETVLPCKPLLSLR